MGETSPASGGLGADFLRLVRLDLQRGPRDQGYARDSWSGALLSRHLAANYRITLGERHCRRILRRFGIPAAAVGRPGQRIDEATKPIGKSLLPTASASRPWSELHRKEVALRRIRKLAASAMPVLSFVYTLLDLAADAIPTGVPQALWADASRKDSLVFKDLDLAKWGRVWGELTANDDVTAYRGFRRRGELEPAHDPVFRFQEFTAADYYQSPLYKEFFRPLKLDQGLLAVLRDQGELVGFYPVFRSRAMPCFGADDIRFLAAAAPHIACGLKATTLLPASWVSKDAPCDFAQDMLLPAENRPSLGIVILDWDGRVLSLNKQAEAMFLRSGRFDGFHLHAFSPGLIRSSLEYIAKTLRGIFRDDRPSSRGGAEEAAVPSVRLFSSAAGVVLKLRGYSMAAEYGCSLTVLVEEVEPAGLFRQRMMYRYGLSPREAEVLALRRGGLTSGQIGARLGLSVATVKTYLRQISVKVQG